MLGYNPDSMKTCLIVLAVALLLFAIVAMLAAVVIFFIARKRRGSDVVTTDAAPVATSSVAPSDATSIVDLSTVAVPVPVQRYGSFVFLTGPLSGKRHDVTPEGVWIGRDESSKLVLPMSSVSKRHAWVGARNGRAVVVDEGSTNGTFLDSRPGQRITEHELEPGEVIIVADDVARFRYER